MTFDEFVAGAVADCVEARWTQHVRPSDGETCLYTTKRDHCIKCGWGYPPLPATVTITAYGQPAPQGSKRHVGNGVMVESSKAVKPWREAVKSAALEAMDGAPALDGPLVVSMVFTLRKPASAPKKRRTWPDRTPDLSKLCRATEDALTDAGVWADDARVVEYQRLAKVFPGEDVAALHIPGVVVNVAVAPC